MKTFLFLGLIIVSVPVLAETECGIRAVKSVETPQTDTAAAVKPLLIHGIELYLQQKYEVAIKYFQEVQKLDPQNELAQMYIESSRQKITEVELQKQLDEQNKALDK